MGHAHGSLNCPDCSSMGLKPRPDVYRAASRPSPSDDRLTTAGFEHVYSTDRPADPNCATDALAVVTVSEVSSELLTAPLQALARAVEEHGTRLSDHVAKLEGASYRIGYLEAMLSAREDQLKLLPDLRAAAAKSMSNERRSQELQEKVQELELEIANLRNAWWYRLARWLVGQ